MSKCMLEQVRKDTATPKHRALNGGTITQRPDGRWCTQVTLNGRWLTRYPETQRECRG